MPTPQTLWFQNHLAWITVLALGLAGESVAFGSTTQSTLHTAPAVTHKNGMRWQITPISQSFRTGRAVLVRGVLSNAGKIPLWYTGWGPVSPESFHVIGPGKRPTPALRLAAWTKGELLGGSRMGGELDPGQRRAIGSVVANVKADMTLPGRYEVFGYYQGVRSNPIFVRILRPSRPAAKPVLIATRMAKHANRVRWGPPWHGLELRLYQVRQQYVRGSVITQINHPRLAYVLLRAVGQRAVTVRLSGLPDQDFANLHVTGPTGKRVDRGSRHFAWVNLTHRPVPWTAYGNFLARHPPHAVRLFKLVIQPGQIYRYGRPIVLTERFDMSLRGHYRVWSFLTGTDCRTDTMQTP